MPFISALYVYPIKSCAGIALQAADVVSHGLRWDRHWMVVEGDGRFVSQREYPRMATIRTALAADRLELSAPTLHDTFALPFDAPAHARTVRVTVWKDSFRALDEGDAAAQWFSRALAAPVRLVRFDPDPVRHASRKWTGEIEAPVQFADGFPLLVTNESSLDEINRRLAGKGASAVPMNRFRPNIVLAGDLDAFDEDYVDTVRLDAHGEHQRVPVVLRLVKPCARCPITTVDQTRGAPDPAWPHEPLDTLAGWRADPRVDGGLTFGQNAIVIAGQGGQLRVGDATRCEWHFPG
ncbi:MOSC domain-containing protein [Paraburkholderia sp. SOS3]|jgi:uncharacterized protein YcbX|uniref:MOSC domain-containing protein n=1 Tax=Paraburkholderia sp. SOS3 TaxID=1926494 RepID=UPI0009476536|nr:MOSC N-terminal beta barrel domain-containing protein [Paraburkholderia sp. SOS3]APR39382.1 MOSC domain-containing protein [Paraburkholderia sp. SOS3]